ncbi:MAG: DUF2007 domain-containing protein [Desulfuromonadales bacterium]|nr:DUF2007 domain-containing protein [Desulfuromonadales bacterium]
MTNKQEKKVTENFVTIATYSAPYEANLAKASLESAGIPVFIADEYTIGINWLYSNALGGVKVQVPESMAKQAYELLSYNIPTVEKEYNGLSCPKCGSKKCIDFMDKRGTFITWLLLGIPLLFPIEKSKCEDCGYCWKK